MANHKRQFCLNNHDTSIMGRDTNNRCRQCAKTSSNNWYFANLAKARASIKKWHVANKDSVKDRVYKRTYGISLADYGSLLLKQSGKCLLCSSGSKLVVDHCHKTGKVRGLLCHSCNRGIGFLGDDPSRLRAGADYLEQAA